MKSDLDKIIAGLKYWGLKLNKPSIASNYESRLLIQKLTYLCKTLGMDFNYKFNLYKNGPYCPTLTRDYYDHSEDVVQFKTSYSPAENDLKIYKTIDKFILKHKIFIDHRADLLEAVSTVQFLRINNPKALDDVIFEKTKEEKHYLSDRLIIIAINIVKQVTFETGFLTQELKDEIDFWEKADD